MSLDTYSIFYYIEDDVTLDNRNLNFNEGSGELLSEVDTGSFTLTDLAIKVQDAFNNAGLLTYAVSFDRDTRKYTISSDTAFDLLTNTGSQADSSLWSVLGFNTGSDLTGQLSYTSDFEAGDFYEPQFVLQDFVDKTERQEFVDASVNESTNAVVESLTFGRAQFYELNIKYITDKPMDGKVIKSNPNGVSDAIDFLKFITLKKNFEFMPDISVRATFDKLLLERTPLSQNGTGFKLQERIPDNLPNYYDTGVLVMRVIL